MLHLALYLFLSNPPHTLENEIKTANSVLMELKTIDCGDPRFFGEVLLFKSELELLSNVISVSSDKEVKKNEKELREFKQAAEQVIRDKEDCVNSLEIAPTPHSKI
jgi:hypothetical protein